MANPERADRSVWLLVDPRDEPVVTGHVEGADHGIGERYAGHDWRQAVAWARVRADQVFLRFGGNDFTYWAGRGPLPRWDRDRLRPLPERPMVYADEWLAELGRRQREGEERERHGPGGPVAEGPRRSGPRRRDLDALRRADLQRKGHGGAQGVPFTMASFVVGAVEQVEIGCTDLAQLAAFWAAATGGTVARAVVLGQAVDWALAAQDGVRPEVLLSARQQPGRVQLTVEVEDLEERVRRLQELGGQVLERGRFHVVVADPEGNRALLAPLRGRAPGAAGAAAPPGGWTGGR
jgi:predicted enzyme related to lactoylglutathione lyase